MEVIAHRGFWEKKEDQNTLNSFRFALKKGFGIETDLRDHAGEIIISHDIPVKAHISLDIFLKDYSHITDGLNTRPTLALNIKSDGLQQEVKKILSRHNIDTYFFFDMSIPDTIGYIKSNLRIFTRRSEYEECSQLIDYAEGVWIDQFQSNWINASLICGYRNREKKVCIVSPELHGREYKEFWEDLRENIDLDDSNIMICTDHPIEAERFFNE